MRITLVFSIAAILLMSSCGVKKELAASKLSNEKLSAMNSDLRSQVIDLKNQVVYLDEQLQMTTGAEMIDGVERNDILDKSNIVLNAAEVMPQFPGELTFIQYMEEKLNLEGTPSEPGVVFTEMVVLEDGSLSGFKSVGGSSLSQQAQAVKLIKATSPWTPGEINGVRVKVRMVIPITFK